MYPIPPIPQLTMLIPTLMELYQEQRKVHVRAKMPEETEPLGSIVVSKRFVAPKRTAAFKPS